MTDSLSSSPRKMWLWLYGSTKSLATSCPLCGSMQVKRWQGNIWQLAKRTSGQMSVLTCWTGNTWTLLSRTRRICTGCGGPSNIWVFVVQGFRSAVTLVSCFLTSDAQIVDDGRQQHSSCSAPMTTAPDYLLKSSMNWQCGCHKTTKQTQRSCIGSLNTFSWEETSLSPWWGSCPLSSRHLLTARTSLDGGTSQKVTS